VRQKRSALGAWDGAFVRLRAFSIYGLPETIPIDKAANSRLVHIKKRQPVLQGLQSKAAR
jgi:hypothetical protein